MTEKEWFMRILWGRPPNTDNMDEMDRMDKTRWFPTFQLGTQ